MLLWSAMGEQGVERLDFGKKDQLNRKKMNLVLGNFQYFERILLAWYVLIPKNYQILF